MSVHITHRRLCSVVRTEPLHTFKYPLSMDSRNLIVSTIQARKHSLILFARMYSDACKSWISFTVQLDFVTPRRILSVTAQVYVKPHVQTCLTLIFKVVTNIYSYV